MNDQTWWSCQQCGCRAVTASKRVWPPEWARVKIEVTLQPRSSKRLIRSPILDGHVCPHCRDRLQARLAQPNG